MLAISIAAEPIELDAFAIVSVEPDGNGSHLITGSGDPNWAHRYVWHDPVTVKRAMRIAMRRMMSAPVAAAPKPAVAMPVKSIAEQLDDMHGRG